VDSSEKIRRCGLTRGGVSVELGFEFSNEPTPGPVSLSLPAACRSGCTRPSLGLCLSVSVSLSLCLLPVDQDVPGPVLVCVCLSLSLCPLPADQDAPGPVLVCVCLSLSLCLLPVDQGVAPAPCLPSCCHASCHNDPGLASGTVSQPQ
jgi:hypothetical protein